MPDNAVLKTRLLRRIYAAAMLMLFLFTSFGLYAQPDAVGRTLPRSYSSASGVEFRVQELVRGLNRPWSLGLLPGENSSRGAGIDGFIALRPGELYYFTNLPPADASVSGGETEFHRVRGLPDIHVRRQGGLLDIFPDPDFHRNRFVYFSLSKPRGISGSATALYRGRFNTDGYRLENLTLLYEMQNATPSNIHYGSRIAMDNRGMLYVSTGDRGSSGRAQDDGDSAGGIVRLDPVENDGSGRDWTLYTTGNRNVQGMAWDPRRELLIAHEHGPKGGDEINIIREGRNYGWPEVSYGVNYDGSPVSSRSSMPGVEEPLLHWTPSIAPSGLAVYPSDGVFAMPGERGFDGGLFAGALAGAHLRFVKLPRSWEDRRSLWPINENPGAFPGYEEEQLLSGELGRIRDVRVDENGYIYLLTDADNGGLYRLIPAE
ncbi:PQQ-dependent sugar dehydrogenase [Salinispira pacifica]|uniref:PQQ-dependent oxidoreductase, gdhB family n=1 Tax=Salinispira pacifica TaxID=1307761 RepID=V5WFW3_9SPIO|nr:PQQ-dependent sugar dehydrogenase [Salinispira pacifica]AHC14683.1 PQQ-dependent oxidoreductase, gdhB family [Salinispira pacifica]